MEYSFINDPVLRAKLEKACKKNFVKTKPKLIRIDSN